MLYNYLLTRSIKSSEMAQKELQQSFDKSYELYNYLLKLIIDLTDLQERYLDEARHKFLPTYEDLNPNPKFINNQLVAIFNYAVKYYGLKENPCHKAGGMGKKKADEMLFWTKDEFSTFIEAVKDKPASYAIFMTLYYTGMREGELLALMPADIDFEKSTVTINKSYQRIGGKDIVSTPKTPKSNRMNHIFGFQAICMLEIIFSIFGSAGRQSGDQMRTPWLPVRINPSPFPTW
jgi:integrase